MKKIYGFFLLCLVLILCLGTIPFRVYSVPLTDAQAVTQDADNLTIGFVPGNRASNVTGNITLPAHGANGSSIAWSSDKPDLISNAGVVSRPNKITRVELSATVSKGSESSHPYFVVLVVPNGVNSLNTIQQTVAGFTKHTSGDCMSWQGNEVPTAKMMGYMDLQGVQSFITTYNNLTGASGSTVNSAMLAMVSHSETLAGDTSGFSGIKGRLNQEFGAVANDESGTVYFLEAVKYLQNVSSDNMIFYAADSRIDFNLNCSSDIRTHVNTFCENSLNRGGAINNILSQYAGQDILTKFLNYSAGIINGYPSEIQAFASYLKVYGLNVGCLAAYNGNGNTGGSVPTDSNYYTQGATVTVSGNTGSLVKTGYTFTGWNTAADGSGTSYTTAGTFVMGSTYVTLYAKWTINSYTLNYAAGAHGTITGTVTQSVYSGANGTAVTAVPNAGYHFVSWSDGGTTANRTDSNVSGNLNVTATFAIDTGNWQDASNTDTTWYGDGAAATFEISTSAQLAGLAKLVNSDIDFSEKTINLSANIDLAAHEWTPIGKHGKIGSGPMGEPTIEDYLFGGTFNGNNHTIRGLYINNPTVNTQGLFGSSNSPEISNLNLVGVNIKGKDNVGGLVGRDMSTLLSNCYVSGSITGVSYTGGLVGESWAYISTCSTDVSISATGNGIGGLIGVDNGEVKSCYSNGTVSVAGSDCNVGGLVGITGNGYPISNSYTSSNVTFLGTGGTNSIGGLIGSFNYCSVINCFVTGTITATGSGTNYIGGFVGEFRPNYNNATNAFSKCYFADNRGTAVVGHYAFDDSSEAGNCTNQSDLSFYKTRSTYTTASNWDGAEPWNFTSDWNFDNTINGGFPYLLGHVDTPSAAEQSNAAIATAQALVPLSLIATEGSNTNVLTYLNGITGMSDTGTTLTLDSSNANVANDGTITYTGSAVIGNVVVHINKTDGTEGTKTIAVTIPAHVATTGYSVTFIVYGGSSVSSINNVAAGTAITAPPAPDKAGFIFGGWYKNAGLSTAWNFATDAVTADTTLYAKWTAAYTLNYAAGANGTITGTVTQSVYSGANGTVITAVPNAGYHFVSWNDGGTAASRTDRNVVSNISVTATFAEDAQAPTPTPVPTPYILNYAAGANGTITGTAVQTVTSGASGTVVTAVPNAGYHFVSWSDGGTTATRTDSNVASNLSVTATFAVDAAKVPGAPTAVAAVAGNAQVTVSFSASSSDGGSAITGYIVTSSPGGITAAGTTSPITVSGLTNGTAYTFTVTATNAVGPGAASSASTSVIPKAEAKVPGAPTAVAAVAGNAQATVSFSVPLSDGGSAITGYTVTSNPGGLTATGTVSPITVSGLTNGTAYTFTVTATNAFGTGAPSTASTSVTPLASAVCEITAVTTPANATLTGTNILANVDNATPSVTAVVSVSENASWKLYSDAACIVEIPNQQLSLIEGANTAYIKVSAPDGKNSKIYTLKVIRALKILKTGRSILEYSLAQQSGPALVNPAAQTVSLEVSSGTSLTGLAASFTLSPGAKALIGTVEQVSSSTANDFTNPVIYTIKAEDGKTAQWTVTVKVTQSKEKNILSFSLPGQTGPALINNANGTIDVEVNETTDLTNLIASFTLSTKAQAKVGGLLQASGASNNNYTDQLEYQVKAEDGSSKNWTVTVNVRTTTPTVTLENIQNGGIITNSRPLFSGKTSKKSLLVNIYLDGSFIGSTSANYYKEWNFTPTSPLADGNHKLRIEVKDGNLSGQTDERTFIVATANSAQITLNANPTTLVGDGQATTTIEVFVHSNKQIPLAGVSVALKVSAGTLSGNQVVTGADGKARVIMTAPRLSGVIPRQEYFTARVNREDLNVESSVAIQFQPASIEGIVLDRSKADRPPIAGAQVELKEDLNNDGVIDFTASTTTGADGRYKIYVPVGNRSYTPLITIPVQVGNQTISMQVSQRTDVGELSGVGETINANQNISGKLMVGQADGNGVQEIQQVFSGDNVSASLLTSTGDVVQGTVQVNQDGSFNIQNVLPGDYTVRFKITAPNGEQLASQTAQVSIKQEGEMSVAITLIDPYGIVSDETSGQPVSGVNMQLFWAATPLNSDQGRKAETLVNLPELPNFTPNRNLVPQLSSSTGEYAWMVFPNGDYYIVAEKSGYQTYDSRQEKRNVAVKPGEDSWVSDGIIHVGQSIVNYDLKIRPTNSGSGSGGGSGGGGSSSGGSSTTNTAIKPRITLIGNPELTISINSPYNDAGATAKDSNGIDITSRVVTVNTVTPAKAGDYTVTYNVTDSAGNVADQVLRTVHVTAVSRLSGLESVDTALEIAKASYQEKVANVILATSENYPDALVASVLAYKLKAPILLVGRSEADQEKILEYLKEHMNATGTVYISGGTAVVSREMEAKLTASGFSKIIRLGGNDRYETAIEIAEYLEIQAGTPIVLAYGENYPDALAVSSAAAVMQTPILLVQKASLSEGVKKTIAEIKPSKVYIIGLQGVISAEVESQVAQITSLDKANIVRIGGVDRFETSLEVAKYFNLSGQNVCVATGNNFPDALTGSVYAANSNAPIILGDVNLTENAKAYIKSRKMTGATIFGGEGVLSKEVEQELSKVIGQN